MENKNHGIKLLGIITGIFFIFATFAIKVDQWMGWEKARNERKLVCQLARLHLPAGGFSHNLEVELDVHSFDTDFNRQEDARRESERSHETTTSTDHNGNEHIFCDGAELV